MKTFLYLWVPTAYPDTEPRVYASVFKWVNIYSGYWVGKKVLQMHSWDACKPCVELRFLNASVLLYEQSRVCCCCWVSDNGSTSQVTCICIAPVGEFFFFSRGFCFCHHHLLGFSEPPCGLYLGWSQKCVLSPWGASIVVVGVRGVDTESILLVLSLLFRIFLLVSFPAALT